MVTTEGEGQRMGSSERQEGAPGKKGSLKGLGKGESEKRGIKRSLITPVEMMEGGREVRGGR